MITYRQAVGAVARATGHRSGHVDHVGRRLQEAGVLPTGPGGPTPALLGAEHAALLLIGTISGAPLKDTAAAACRLAELTATDQLPTGRRPRLIDVVALCIGDPDWPRASLEVDVASGTARVRGIGDQMLRFGLPSDDAVLTSRSRLAPGALHRLAHAINSVEQRTG